MRDKKRIPKTLKLIEKIWTKYPDLRLMQLILNCVDEGASYHTEDKELVKILKDTYEIWQFVTNLSHKSRNFCDKKRIKCIHFFNTIDN